MKNKTVFEWSKKEKKTFFIRFLLWVKHCIVRSGIVHEMKYTLLNRCRYQAIVVSRRWKWFRVYWIQHTICRIGNQFAQFTTLFSPLSSADFSVNVKSTAGGEDDAFTAPHLPPLVLSFDCLLSHDQLSRSRQKCIRMINYWLWSAAVTATTFFSLSLSRGSSK